MLKTAYDIGVARAFEDAGISLEELEKLGGLGKSIADWWKRFSHVDPRLLGDATQSAAYQKIRAGAQSAAKEKALLRGTGSAGRAPKLPTPSARPGVPKPKTPAQLRRESMLHQARTELKAQSAG